MSGKIFLSFYPSWFLCVCIGIICLWTGTTTALELSPVRIVEVESASPYSGDDISVARDRTIAKALLTAVEQVAVDLYGSRLHEQDIERLKRQVRGGTQRFILDYKVITETASQEEYWMMVQATVSVEELQSVLRQTGMMGQSHNLPDILILIAEQGVEDLSPQHWWSLEEMYTSAFATTAMGDALAAKGYRVLNAGVSKQAIATGTSDKALLSDAEASYMGKLAGAEVVIVGTAVAQKGPQSTQGANVRTFRATIDVRALRTDNGIGIGALVDSAVSVSIDDMAGSKSALGSAGLMAADKLATQMAQSWQDSGVPTMSLEVMVSGISNLKAFVRFRRILTSLPGIKGLYIKAMNAKSALISVAATVDARQLASQLRQATYDMFGIKVGDVQQGLLYVAISPNAAVTPAEPEPQTVSPQTSDSDPEG
jgi:hypothetical protein